MPIYHNRSRNARVRLKIRRIILNLPEAFITKYQKLLGTESERFFASFEQPVKHGFRVNPLKKALPATIDLSEPTPFSRWGYFGRVKGKSMEHQTGAVYSQEPVP